ncbi:MAG: hypothetical protein VYA67_21935 [Actinomycetota bacterium]|nr:hypothetical protein [Actinomycetota bacterium]
MTQPETIDAAEAQAGEKPASENARHAREQAKEYKSQFAPIDLKLDSGDVIEVPPEPRFRLLDDDALMELDRLHLDLESYDRHDDYVIPEQTIKNAAGNEIKLPEERRQGALKEPYRKTDPTTNEAVLMDPPYQVRVAQIALGEDYAKLRAGLVNGKRGSAADVWRIWNEASREIAERERNDSKSSGGAGVLEGVPASDSE